ncbi:MAG: nucleotidyltransferase family protein [bacterium]|nr:nucleotidyltransferase family protein [bacterium]
MQAVILAAGFGLRLRPLTETTPKALIRVGGKPIIEHTLAVLPAVIDECIVVVHHLGECIQAHLGERWGDRRIRYVTQGDLLGTGHAIHAARELLHGAFLVCNGDDLYRAADLERMVTHDLAIMLCDLEWPVRAGAPICDMAGRLLEIREDTETTFVNAGCYMLDERFFRYPLVQLPGRNEYGLPQTLVCVARDHAVATVRTNFWVPVGTPEELALAQQRFALLTP